MIYCGVTPRGSVAVQSSSRDYVIQRSPQNRLSPPFHRAQCKLRRRPFPQPFNMASLLRQIVAGPRSRHPETGLDLCYVTDQLIATSGPSATYPQRAYRNPLDQLVRFLDSKHGDGWAIWEFRAEGAGYPDEEVYGRVWHYPWPDHHPPPFRLVPMILASMRNWLREREDRVVVVHCKAGKGRSGTIACSYLIAECGWTPAEALARFTERRMRPGFGQGVSIPSQLRWIGYVDRWAKAGKLYVDRQIEIVEVHVWGLRDGVKVQIEGFVNEGKVIKIMHTFTKRERVVVEGNAPGSGGITDMLSDMAGFQTSEKGKESESTDSLDKESKTIPRARIPETASPGSSSPDPEAGGRAVIFRPSKKVVVPSSDVNIDIERRNKASMGWTMVTAVAHVWFNAYFEGNGPEQNGKPDDTGVFEIDWDKLDGIKGSSRKGTRALDRLAVVWKVHEPEPGRGGKEDVIREPGVNSPVPQMAAADWKGGNETSPGLPTGLGLRSESPCGADVSKANSVNSNIVKGNGENDADLDSFEGLKISPTPEEGGLEDELGNVNLDDSPKPDDSHVPNLSEVNAGLNTASSTTPQQGSGT